VTPQSQARYSFLLGGQVPDQPGLQTRRSCPPTRTTS